MKGEINMVQNYVLLTDSSSDLCKELAQELDIRVLPLDVIFEGGKCVRNDEIDPKYFYERLRAKETITTSAVRMERFAAVMAEIAEEGKDVLYLGFSSGLSATYQAGKVAAIEMSEKYPERKFMAVDTLCASLGQGLLVTYAARMRKAGKSMEEVAQWVEDNKLHLCHWFTVDDLFFLKRGGRVSAATAVMGSMLAIKPVMHTDNAGKLTNVGKVRGRKASIDALFEKLKTTSLDLAGQTIYISHGDCIEDARYLADRICRELGVEDIMIDYVGPVIGAHSGPGTLALFFLGRER